MCVQIEQMERDLQQVFDDKEEQETERDIYKNKYERLNQELNYILKGDENRILDIDALSMENKWVEENTVDNIIIVFTGACGRVVKAKTRDLGVWGLIPSTGHL